MDTFVADEKTQVFATSLASALVAYSQQVNSNQAADNGPRRTAIAYVVVVVVLIVVACLFVFVYLKYPEWFSLAQSSQQNQHQQQQQQQRQPSSMASFSSQHHILSPPNGGTTATSPLNGTSTQNRLNGATSAAGPSSHQKTSESNGSKVTKKTHPSITQIVEVESKKANDDEIAIEFESLLLHIKNTKGDGHCFFHAIGNALYASRNSEIEQKIINEMNVTTCSTWDSSDNRYKCIREFFKGIIKFNSNNNIEIYTYLLDFFNLSNEIRDQSDEYTAFDYVQNNRLSSDTVEDTINLFATVVGMGEVIDDKKNTVLWGGIVETTLWEMWLRKLNVLLVIVRISTKTQKLNPNTYWDNLETAYYNQSDEYKKQFTHMMVLVNIDQKHFCWTTVEVDTKNYVFLPIELLPHRIKGGGSGDIIDYIKNRFRTTDPFESMNNDIQNVSVNDDSIKKLLIDYIRVYIKNESFVKKKPEYLYCQMLLAKLVELKINRNWQLGNRENTTFFSDMTDLM